MMTLQDEHLENDWWSVFFDNPLGSSTLPNGRWYDRMGPDCPWRKVIWYDDNTPAQAIGRTFKRNVDDALLSLIL